MRIGIIDFGTNTLRLDIFETEDEKYKIIYDDAIYSKIVENTVGNSLSQDGIEHIIQAIEEHQAVCRHYRCDRIECFSTASLRYIDNAENVIEQVEFRSGIRITMISGDDEAKYDFKALKSVSSVKNGIGCDLGGGSFQLFTFDENGPIKSASFPLGSSRMAKKYSSATIPTLSEIANIKDEVFKALSDTGFERSGGTLLAMGGTAKTLKKLYNSVLGKEGTIILSDVSLMLKLFTDEPDETAELVEEIEPKRVHTLVPGIAVLSSIAEYMGCGGIDVYSVGVREGFLESILSGEDGGGQNILDFILSNL